MELLYIHMDDTRLIFFLNSCQLILDYNTRSFCLSACQGGPFLSFCQTNLFLIYCKFRAYENNNNLLYTQRFISLFKLITIGYFVVLLLGIYVVYIAFITPIYSLTLQTNKQQH